MKISIHVNITNPEYNQYPYLEAIASYCDLADEVVIVDGGSTDGSLEKIKQLNEKIKIVENLWPQDEWSWEQIGVNTNIGFENCTGDWAIKVDIDYIFHENDIPQIIAILRKQLNNKIPSIACSFDKNLFILADGYYHKSKMPIAVNKRDYGDLLAYGAAFNKDPDFMWAIFKRKKINDIWVGDTIYDKELLIKNIGASIWVYSFTFMTKKIMEERRPVFDLAYIKYHYTNVDAISKKVNMDMAMTKIERMTKSRYKDHQERNELITINHIKDHPKYIQEKLRNLKPEQFGYNAFGWIEDKAELV